MELVQLSSAGANVIYPPEAATELDCTG